jgi:hypothetical protein
MPADKKATMSLIVAFAALPNRYFAGAGDGVAGAGVAVEADDTLMDTHGCSGAFWPGSTDGLDGRIIPAGHGAISSVGLTSGGSGGASTAPFDVTLSFDPGHA